MSATAEIEQNEYVRQLADADRLIEALVEENEQLREENAKHLRVGRRPRVVT